MIELIYYVFSEAGAFWQKKNQIFNEPAETL